MGAKFRKGQPVVLPANEDEGWAEQRGVVVEVEDQDRYPGMYVVQVEPEDEDDDGLREVHEDHMREEGVCGGELTEEDVARARER